MSYFQRYKKRALKSGTTQSEIVRKQSLINFDRNFEHIIGCTDVVINNEISTKMIIESMQDDLQKTATTRSTETVHVGDYLTFNKQTWIVKTINYDILTPVCHLLWCNQQLNFEWTKAPILCHANNTSYGSKGIVDIGSRFLELDAKTKIYIQKNEDTDLLYLGYRLMMNHRYIYKITEIENTVFGGIYVITCQMDEANAMDDFENNIAYNKKVMEKPIENETEKEIEDLPSNEKENLTSIELEGFDTLKRKTEGIYILKGSPATRWEVDEEEMVQIEIIDQSSVKLTTLKQAGWITLTAYYQNTLTQIEEKISKDIIIA